MFGLLAVVGLVLLIAALLSDGLFDGALDALVPDTPWITFPAIAAAIAAFGATGWILQSQASVSVGLAATAGVGTAFIGGWGAIRMSRAVMGMATDATPRSGDLVGSMGRVVTPVAVGSSGEVIVRLAGQPVKLTALSASETELSTGTEVIVVDVHSATKVTVQRANDTWAELA